MGIENGLGNGHGLSKDAVCGGSQRLTGRSHRERNGTGESGVPHHKTAVGGSNEQAIVHSRQFAGDFLGKDNSHYESETPVEPAGDGRHGRHEGYSAGRQLGQRSQCADGLLHHRSSGQRRATHEHQGHLHGKRQQVPYASTPMLHHFNRGLVTDGHRQQCGDKSEDDSKDKGFRKIALHHFDAAGNHALKHIRKL